MSLIQLLKCILRCFLNCCKVESSLSPKTKLFENGLQSGSFRKRRFPGVVWTGETELFENADITASHHHPSEHALVSSGVRRGHVACLFSFIEFRISLSNIEFYCRIANFECYSVFVRTGIFLKTVLVWTRIFFIRIKKDAFSKRSGYVWTGWLKLVSHVAAKCNLLT